MKTTWVGEGRAPGSGEISVRSVLDLPVLRRGLPSVVAGADALDRPVRWVHAGEIADMAAHLRGGELLLTTGLGIGRLPEQQRTYVRTLAARGVAGLVVELGMSVAELPRPLIAAANACELPLVALTASVNFVEVTEAAHALIVSRAYVAMCEAENVRQRLTDVLLNGGGIPEVLAATAEVVRNPVFLESPDGDLMYHAGDPGDGHDALSAWRSSNAGRGRWAEGVDVPVALSAHGAPARLRALPIARAIEEHSARILERAAGVLTLALLRSRQEEQLLARRHGDVLLDLVEGRHPSERSRAHAEVLGLTSRSGLFLPVAVRGHRADDVTWSLVIRDLASSLERAGEAAIVGRGGGPGRVLGVVAVRTADDREAVAGRVADAVRAALRRHGGLPSVVVAVGEVVAWGDIATSLRLAVDTAAIAPSDGGAAWVDVRHMELDRLFWSLRDESTVRELVERRLGAVLEHDRTHRHVLFPTLEALCAGGWRKAEAARLLHLNRAALYRRVERLEEVLGVDLSDRRQTLVLDVALRAHPHVARGAGREQSVRS
ncbi:MAG: PucR family transcriptional regulator [Patulibacter sp.]|nr:PucR family transcriptional regulator [Patulibacter sp.]